MFFGDGIIEIGDNVAIENGTIIYSSKDGWIKFGDYSMIAAHCYIIDADYGTSKNEKICNQKTM